ncbi:MAG: HD domain-containing protein [Terracidiphilus sp.]
MKAGTGHAPDAESREPLLHLAERFSRAVDYARILHIERRKGSEIPFMAHLLGVASLVMGEAGHVPFPVTEDMVIAALLHDAVEDHGGAPRLEDIASNFGPNVARMVEGLSDTLAEDPNQKEPWEQRKKAYLERLRNEPADVQLISAADKLYNARTILDDYRKIGPDVWNRFKRGRGLQLWYFNALLEIFNASGTNRIVEELARVVAELTRISAEEGALAKERAQA